MEEWEEVAGAAGSEGRKKISDELGRERRRRNVPRGKRRGRGRFEHRWWRERA